LMLMIFYLLLFSGGFFLSFYHAFGSFLQNPPDFCFFSRTERSLIVELSLFMKIHTYIIVHVW